MYGIGQMAHGKLIRTADVPQQCRGVIIIAESRG